jgi:hypothetical protein
VSPRAVPEVRQSRDGVMDRDSEVEQRGPPVQGFNRGRFRGNALKRDPATANLHLHLEN